MPTLPIATVTAFARSERGGVAILFGVCAMVLTVTIGVAIDHARVHHSTSKLAAAADAAALAAGRALMEGAMSDEEVAELGERFFNQNLSGGGKFADIAKVEVIPDRANSTIEVKVDADVPMTFMRIAGFQTVAVPVDTVTTFEANDLELGMALDITGSMSGRKLADLKTAATDLISILMPDGVRPNRVRIGLAPYAAAIQLGAYADRASNGTSRDGCVRERTGRSAYLDDSIRRRRRLSGYRIFQRHRSHRRPPGILLPGGNDRPADGRQGGVDGIDQSLRCKWCDGWPYRGAVGLESYLAQLRVTVAVRERTRRLS